MKKENNSIAALVRVIEENHVSPTVSERIANQFAPFAEQLSEWMGRNVGELVVTDESEVDKMAMAREARLAIRGLRTGADKVRKAMKADSLNYGRAVQAAYNALAEVIVPLEEHLKEQEEFVERKREREVAALREEREKRMQDADAVVFEGVDVGLMTEDAFDALLEGAKMAKAKREADAKAEEERIRAEEDRRKREAVEAALKREREAAAEREAERAKEAEREKRELVERMKAEMEAKIRAERKAVEEQKATAAKEAETETERRPGETSNAIRLSVLRKNVVDGMLSITDAELRDMLKGPARALINAIDRAAESLEVQP